MKVRNCLILAGYNQTGCFDLRAFYSRLWLWLFLLRVSVCVFNCFVCVFYYYRHRFCKVCFCDERVVLSRGLLFFMIKKNLLENIFFFIVNI